MSNQEELEIQLAVKTAECKVYRDCCSRAFQLWVEDHPRASKWPDGAQQIVDVMHKQEARISELEDR